jgi:hypothetical protein
MTPDDRHRAHAAASAALTRHVTNDLTRTRVASRIVDSLATWSTSSLPWILSAGTVRRAESLDVYDHAEVAALTRSAVDAAVLAATNAILKP